MSKTYLSRAPSNIAFIKYWGKQQSRVNWPANNSLSMTLNAAHTETQVQMTSSSADQVTLGGIELDPQDKRNRKIFDFLSYLHVITDNQQSLKISSTNHFPTGCGIASSASGFAALTIAGIAALTNSSTLDQLSDNGYPPYRLAAISRRGSGSSCRSFFGGFVLWQKGESQDQQIVDQQFKAEHWPLTDTIVILDSDEKKIPSTEAHKAAWTSPFFAPRLAIIPERECQAIAAIRHRSLAQLGPLIENEALEMHSIIATAAPAYQYLTKSSLDFISQLRNWRRRENLAVYFTIDAGPNIHVITDRQSQPKLKLWLDDNHYQYLQDDVGHGPSLTTTDFCNYTAPV